MSLRDSMRSTMQQLEMSARSSFEVDLFVNDPSTVSLADSEMEKIKVSETWHHLFIGIGSNTVVVFCSKELKQGLDIRMEQNQKKAGHLRSTIETLWERLNIDTDMREMFLMENRGFSPSTIQHVSLFLLVAL